MIGIWNVCHVVKKLFLRKGCGMTTEIQVQNQIVLLMTKIEQLCQERMLTFPVRATVIVAEDKQWAFVFGPYEMDLLLPPPVPPFILRLTDALGNSVEELVTELSVRKEPVLAEKESS